MNISVLNFLHSTKQTGALRGRNFLRDSRVAGASIEASSTCGDRSCAGHHFFFTPRFFIANHAVQNCQQLSHTSNQGNLLFFARRNQSRVELFDDRVEASGRQRGHVKHSPDMTAASENASFGTPGRNSGGRNSGAELWGHPFMIDRRKFGCYSFCCQDHGFEFGC